MACSPWVSWGAMVPAGVAFARFLKRFDPFWFYAHAVAQASAKETKARRYWNLYHHSVGRVAVALASPTSSMALVGDERQEWSYVYGVFIGVFAVVYLVLEEWRPQALIRFILR
ncbi:hypothetical protein HU200_011327 [Digitaria exilis]|uniref:Uncharacterized protein n=1 Tax=Digitaria exilis TaxID=1010633 RepID=A0A835FGW9_9POAL|nr:hypothetical protein HU200_011327 [Digitaria exilis]